jgi:hypothetical protein
MPSLITFGGGSVKSFGGTRRVQAAGAAGTYYAPVQASYLGVTIQGASVVYIPGQGSARKAYAVFTGAGNFYINSGSGFVNAIICAGGGGGSNAAWKGQGGGGAGGLLQT